MTTMQGISFDHQQPTTSGSNGWPSRGVDFSQQVYWFELPVRVPPWKDDAELQRLIHDARQEQLLREAGLTQRQTQGSNRKRPRVNGLVIDGGLTLFSVLNSVMTALRCAPVTEVELLLTVQEVLQRTDADPSIMDALSSLAQRRGLNVDVVSTEELKERKRRIVAGDVELGKQALMLVDAVKPIFVGVIPVMESDREGRRRKHGAMLEILSPLRDPHPFRRRVQRIQHLSYKDMKVVVLTRPAAVQEWASLDESQALGAGREYDEDAIAELAQRLAPQGDPFQAIPLIQTGEIRRQSKRTKYPWYQRILETRAVGELKTAALRQSQLEQLTMEGDDDDDL